jgi:hypothetical protein
VDLSTLFKVGFQVEVAVIGNMCKAGRRAGENRRRDVGPIVSKLDLFWRVDSIPTDPKAVAECDGIAERGQLALDLIVY